MDYGEDHNKTCGHNRFGRIYHIGRRFQRTQIHGHGLSEIYLSISSYMAVLIWCRALSYLLRAQPSAFCGALCWRVGCEGAASDACRQGTQTRDFSVLLTSHSCLLLLVELVMPIMCFQRDGSCELEYRIRAPKLG